MQIQPIKTRLFKEGESLVDFITSHIPKIPNGSVLAVTSKIVALAEGRTRPVTTDAAKARLIKEESQWAMKTKWTWLTVKDHMVMASAGVDESNADGKIILLPKDSFVAASTVRKKLMKHYKLTKFGILITDSRLFPLRAGIVGVALGYAGFKGVRDNRGSKDLFGRRLKMSRVDVADSLATAAVVTMGEAAERQPLALLTKPPVEYTNRINRNELRMDFRDDLYLPLFKKANQIRLKKIPGGWDHPPKK